MYLLASIGSHNRVHMFQVTSAIWGTGRSTSILAATYRRSCSLFSSSTPPVAIRAISARIGNYRVGGRAGGGRSSVHPHLVCRATIISDGCRLRLVPDNTSDSTLCKFSPPFDQRRFIVHSETAAWTSSIVQHTATGHIRWPRNWGQASKETQKKNDADVTLSYTCA